MRNKKKKIAVIGLKGLPAFGGAATVGENIIKKLKNKYDFTVYAIDSHTNKKGNINGFNQIVFKSFPIKKINILYYYIVSALHIVIKGNYDLVHLHHRDAAFIMLILKLRYKVILTTHSIFFLREKWKNFSLYFKLQEKFFVKYANLITCVSLKEQRLFKKYLNKDVFYIPNGINGHEEIYGNKIKNSDYIMFASGRIIQSKGCDIMLEALNIINYKKKIIIAGDLDQTPKYKKKIMKLTANLNVEFTGLLKDKKLLMSFIRHAKYFIFPSSWEAMSMMLLEATSMKTPVICSDIIENRDIFNATEVLFFKTDNPNDLAEKIVWALKNNKLMKNKAKNAYNKLVKNYLWKHICLKYDEFYQQLIND